jgi:hypothetical protein
MFAGLESMEKSLNQKILLKRQDSLMGKIQKPPIVQNENGKDSTQLSNAPNLPSYVSLPTSESILNVVVDMNNDGVSIWSNENSKILPSTPAVPRVSDSSSNALNKGHSNSDRVPVGVSANNMLSSVSSAVVTLNPESMPHDSDRSDSKKAPVGVKVNPITSVTRHYGYTK